MEKIRIEYYGHSCFKVTYGCDSALFDPYETDSVPGINLPAGIEAVLSIVRTNTAIIMQSI